MNLIVLIFLPFLGRSPFGADPLGGDIPLVPTQLTVASVFCTVTPLNAAPSNLFPASKKVGLPGRSNQPLRISRSPATMQCMEALEAKAITQLRKGVLEYCVLGVIRGAERYSYEIVQALSELDGLVTTEGTLYPLLSRLRKDGVVETTWRESSAGPPRRYYRITASGDAAFTAFMTEWTRFRDSVDTALTRGAPK